MEYNIIPDKEALGKCTWCNLDQVLIYLNTKGIALI
jgi:hypothetical protein